MNDADRTPVRPPIEPIIALPAHRVPIMPAEAEGLPLFFPPSTPPAHSEGTSEHITYDELIQKMLAAAPLSDLIKLAATQPGLTKSQNPAPMPDGSPAPSGPIVTGNAEDLTGRINELLNNRDAIVAVFQAMASIGPFDATTDADSVTADELRLLPLGEIADVLDTTGRIASAWASGSDATTPEDFNTAMRQASAALRELAAGGPGT